MRRAGYVRTLEESEEYASSSSASKKASWKKRLFKQKKQQQQQQQAATTTLSERALLVSERSPLRMQPLVESTEQATEEEEPTTQQQQQQNVDPEPQQQPQPQSREQEKPEKPLHPAPKPQVEAIQKEKQEPQPELLKRTEKKTEKKKETTEKKKEIKSSRKKETPPKKRALPVETQERSLPRTPPRESKNASDETSQIRAALSRPFGRSNLPVVGNWVVDVSPAEWDADEERWKYRILVQRRTLEESEDSLTTAFTWRSLADFVWLEKALRAEFHGALLLPLLSIALGTPDVANFTHQDVDATLLQDWLNDVLNGIRGQGELVLNQEPVDIMSSEAMESFLYRNTAPLPSPEGRKNVDASVSQLDQAAFSPEKDLVQESFVDSLLAKPFSCLPIDTMCGPIQPSTPPRNQRKRVVSNGLPMMACSSRALGDATSLNVQDSFSDFDMDATFHSSSLAIHSEVLEAERDLVKSYRQSAMSAMDKGRILIEEEMQASIAWKRLAISLSALYSYEKDIESIRVEEVRQKKRPTYRKLGKTNVEELLRLMTKQKTDRSATALRGLDAMLSSYVGDLSAVNPAIKSYSEAVVRLSNLENTMPETSSSPIERKTSSSSWQEQIRTMANSTLVEVKKHINGESVKSEATSTTQSTEGDGAMSQKRAFEARVLANERLLRDSVTALCRSASIRTARMAWKFFNTEAAQCMLLKSCAHSMRTKVNIINRDALAEMIARHKKESAADAQSELNLVQRIVMIGDLKRVPSSKDLTELAATDEWDVTDDKKQTFLRTEAMDLAKARVGRWDSKVGLAIMKAVGAEEGEVRVDETTRELRLVRKFAIGLRDQLGRCKEALDVLKGVVYHGDPDALISNDDGDAEPPDEKNYLRDSRRHFVDDITDVYSCTLLDGRSSRKPKSASTSVSVLSRAGVELDDPFGWNPAVIPSNTKRKVARIRRGRCGELTMSYTDKKNAATEKLLETLSGLLESYNQRLESIESYVYMQCVGIQLEKHFSIQRSESLAAFEKRTDISTAINIAQRKKLPMLVEELQAKMDALGNVSHTTVKRQKEIHLVSKTLKAELSSLATRRFLRLRETSTERVIGLLTIWAQHEEDAANAEIKALRELIAEVEKQFANVDVTSDGISYKFFESTSEKK